MTAEEMKAAESGAQSAPLPLEGVDISPKQDEGVLKVRARVPGELRACWGRPSPECQSQPLSRRAWKPPAGGQGGDRCLRSLPASR